MADAFGWNVVPQVGVNLFSGNKHPAPALEHVFQVSSDSQPLPAQAGNVHSDFHGHITYLILNPDVLEVLRKDKS